MSPQKGLKHGVYTIYWKEGGKSLASIGFLPNGDNWFAPCNWISRESSTDWKRVKKIKLIKANKYE